MIVVLTFNFGVVSSDQPNTGILELAFNYICRCFNLSCTNEKLLLRPLLLNTQLNS